MPGPSLFCHLLEEAPLPTPVRMACFLSFPCCALYLVTVDHVHSLYPPSSFASSSCVGGRRSCVYLALQRKAWFPCWGKELPAHSDSPAVGIWASCPSAGVLVKAWTILLMCQRSMVQSLSGAEQLYFLLSSGTDNICYLCKHQPALWSDKQKRKSLPMCFHWTSSQFNLSWWTSLPLDKS